ncbi:MAG: adenylate kinase [Nitriliruptorales bacterium]|nr:adenylate kinase [Nitriliruptorales bacterium]
MRVALLGPPASGKGTQASRLAEREGLEHLSTGDLLRAAVEAGTELGSEAQPYMERGELVPDELVLEIVQAELPDEDFVLDGFPRTLAQFDALDAPLDAVVVLVIPMEEAVRRVTGRRVCPEGHVYHVDYDPPEEPGICDLDGEPLRQREDDTEDVVATRWRAYEEQTLPLLDHLEEQTRLERIDGTGPPDAVTERLLATLE